MKGFILLCLADVLNLIDPNHVEKAIEKKSTNEN